MLKNIPNAERVDVVRDNFSRGRGNFDKDKHNTHKNKDYGHKTFQRTEINKVDNH
jgi:hypothetical protein